MRESPDLVARSRETSKVRQEIIGTHDEERDLGRQMDRGLAATSDETKRKAVFDDFAKRISAVRERRRELEQRLASL